MLRVQIYSKITSRDIVALTRAAATKIDGTRVADMIAATRMILHPCQRYLDRDSNSPFS